MSSTDEKLEKFDKIIMEDAERARNAVLKQLSEIAAKRLPEKKAEIDLAVAELYNKEISYSRMKAESVISKTGLNAKKQLLKARKEIIESVMEALRKRLMEFVQSGEYREYLTANLTDALKYAGSGEVEIYITPGDYEKYLDHVQSAVAGIREMRIAPGEESMIGGCKIMNAERGIFVDNSLEKRIVLSVPELFLISGLRVRSEFGASEFGTNEFGTSEFGAVEGE